MTALQYAKYHIPSEGTEIVKILEYQYACDTPQTELINVASTPVVDVNRSTPVVSSLNM